MDINPVSATATEGLVDRDKIGFGGLTSDSFLKLLIAQLQNQDPLEPIGNQELLNQITQMRNLQSNIELSDFLKSIVSGQQLSLAAGFIGKTIEGTDQTGEPVTGVVDRVFVDSGKTFLGVDGAIVPLENVTSVTASNADAA